MKKALILFSLLLLSVLAFSCNSGQEIYAEKYGKDFDNDGGSYEGVGGVTVHIPAGSLPEDIETINVSVFAYDTQPFTNISKTVTNIYAVSPSAIQFKKELTVVIPYKEDAFPPLLDELDLKPYFSLDRENFEVFPEEKYELDVENNIMKISTQYLGNFHLGFPKELVKQENSEIEGVAEMVLIAEGEFDFGAPKGTPTGVAENETGIKESEGTSKVHLSSYYIDKYEVTNAQYQLCEESGVCIAPHSVTSVMYQDYYENPNYAGFPVIYVTWNQASTYCQWAGKELPTEAQWEKAARGQTIKKYPWGDKDPADNVEATVANYSALFGDVTSVYWGDDGVSPYGVYNMAGNVAEWVEDWHGIDSYYKVRTDVLEDPSGPAESPDNEKVIRGGSWVSLMKEITTHSRDKAFPNYRYYNLGFRCVQKIEE